MPKFQPDFEKRIDVWVTAEMRLQLVAISYHMGGKGKYAKSARPLLSIGIESYLENMTAKARKEYEQILKNIALQESLQRELESGSS